jgi:hypothetical protein
MLDFFSTSEVSDRVLTELSLDFDVSNVSMHRVSRRRCVAHPYDVGSFVAVVDDASYDGQFFIDNGQFFIDNVLQRTRYWKFALTKSAIFSLLG